MANKLRHIAISVRDPEKTAKFFEEAFGMTRAGNAQRGVYMTDGIFNVALLNFGDEPVAGMEDQKNPLGLIHFGMWVDSVDEMDKKITAAGGSYVTGRKETEPERVLRGQVQDAGRHRVRRDRKRLEGRGQGRGAGAERGAKVIGGLSRATQAARPAWRPRARMPG